VFGDAGLGHGVLSLEGLYSYFKQKFTASNTFANIVRYHKFWHRTVDLRAKLVLGAPMGTPSTSLAKGFEQGECQNFLCVTLQVRRGKPFSPVKLCCLAVTIDARLLKAKQ